MPKYYKARSGNFYKVEKDNHPIHVNISNPASIIELKVHDFFIKLMTEITEEEFLSACREALMNMGLGKVLNKDKKVKDRFVQGYVCAVANLIRLNDEVNTQTRELFRDGVGKVSLLELKQMGVDESDLAQLKKYYNELKIK